MKHKNVTFLILVVFLSSLSLGAWWNSGQTKEEKAKKQSDVSSGVEPKILEASVRSQDIVRNQPIVSRPAEIQKVVPEANQISLPQVPSQTTLPNLPPLPKVPKAVPINEPLPSVKVPVPEDMIKLQSELSEIITRSSKLQNEVKENRAQIHEIMERAKIHENILKTIKAPQLVKVPTPIDADAIVQREKLRLIAEQTKQAQQQLETIQRTQSIESKRTSS